MKPFQLKRNLQKIQQPKTRSAHLEELPDPNHNSNKQAPLVLIRRLSQALETEGITYCHWKSNNALDRSENGVNDLDLLVERADIPRFTHPSIY
ncbi:MAG: hypothetical protein P8Z00_16465 [Anaerolineales bacterium]